MPLDKIMTATEVRQHYERTHKDARMRAMAQSCVAQAMDEHGPVDPERADRDAHDVASLAAHLLVSRIYTEDAELRFLKNEVEQLRKWAMELQMIRPPSFVIPKE